MRCPAQLHQSSSRKYEGTAEDLSYTTNPLNRYSISARQDLKPNTDGSVDLYIQNQNPGADKESNWLPAPKDKFILMMRLYWRRLGGSRVLPTDVPPLLEQGHRLKDM